PVSCSLLSFRTYLVWVVSTRETRLAGDDETPAWWRFHGSITGEPVGPHLPDPGPTRMGPEPPLSLHRRTALRREAHRLIDRSVSPPTRAVFPMSEHSRCWVHTSANVRIDSWTRRWSRVRLPRRFQLPQRSTCRSTTQS